ncbi:hypothetical protein [Pseudokineococcus sp. 1T1Z-3]|uniref:hypothetical protein n=1 Tax=Pseudokineococcus sp. 1T1Z-3 TaxID=3132745 RepID=UPI0030982274
MRALKARARADHRAGTPDGCRGEDLRSRHLRQWTALALALASLVWVAAAASLLDDALAWAVRGVGLGVASALAVMTLRPGGRSDGIDERVRSLPEEWGSYLGRTLLSMGVLSLLVVLLGALTDVPQVVTPLLTVVVGVHLLVVASVLDQPQLRWAAAGLVAAGAAGIGMLVGLAPKDVVRVVVGGVAALSLWVTALRLALHP